jgi:hypothetical protein
MKQRHRLGFQRREVGRERERERGREREGEREGESGRECIFVSAYVGDGQVESGKAGNLRCRV